MTKRSLALLLSMSLLLSLFVGVVAAQDTDACQQRVDDALSDLATNCANMVSNSACYGVSAMDAAFFDSFAVPDDLFSTPGSHVDLRIVEQFEPFEPVEDENLPDDTWGIVVMQTQTGIPLDQNESPIMIMFGETTLTNNVLPVDAVDVVMEDGQQTPMQAFSLELGEDNAVCDQMLTGLLLQLPEDNDALFWGNEALLRLTADICTTVLFRPDPLYENSMVLEVTSGQVTVFASTDFPITLTTGYQVSLPLDEEGLFMLPETFVDYQIILETVRVIPDEELAQLSILEDLPLNILACPLFLPEVIRPSGVGAPDIIVIPGH